MQTEINKDKVLLKKYLKTNNIELLGELYEPYLHLVYGVCLKYLKNRDDAKDAVNKIFELLIVEIPKFDIDNFRSWLYVVTKNYCLMERRKRRHDEKKFEKYAEVVFMESDHFLHPLDEKENKALEKGLKECIEKLKNEQKASIQLFYYEEKCYEEIAEKMKVPQNKVKSYIQNARRNLKICIENFKVENDI